MNPAKKACRAECEALLRKLTFVLACSAYDGERRIVAKMIEKTALRCARVVGEGLPPMPCDTVLATHERARALNERLADKSAKVQKKYEKRTGWDVDAMVYESFDDEDCEGAPLDEIEEDDEWFCDVEWDEESETWQQVLKRVKPEKKTPPSPTPAAETTDVGDVTKTPLVKKPKTPENWARLKENHRLMKMAKKWLNGGAITNCA